LTGCLKLALVVRSYSVAGDLGGHDFGPAIDPCKATGYTNQVRIRNFIHKGLKGLYLENSSKGVPPDAVDKLRAMLTFLQDMQRVEVLRASPL
jgi:hypothetical protein